jgi:dimethylhistidine N-methyltransferase
MTDSLNHIRPAATARHSAENFAADLQYYLTQDPRQLPSRYLYDALGSALFDAICELPWYRLTRAEAALLDAHAGEVFEGFERITSIVELGPGNGLKLASVLAAAGSRRRGLDVHLVDVSPTALADAVSTLSAFDDLNVVIHEAAYETGLLDIGARRRPPTGRTLVLFLGSNIGNFDPPGSQALLRAIRSSLRPRDALLIGADLIKPKADLLLAYDDPLGVTAAFNRNLIVRINRELGASIDLGGFVHRAVWNRLESRVEMHLVSRRRQRVEIATAGVDFWMDAGEPIWTESSYKFEPDRFAEMLAGSGFEVRKQWLEPADRFLLTMAEAS